MKVNTISNSTSFGRLKINIDKNSLNSAPLKKELAKLKKVFIDNGFSRKKNVNVILDYDMNQRDFVGIVESKKQGIPMNPNYRHIISTSKRDIDSFGKWLNDWDYMYSPKGLREWEEIKKRAAEELQKRSHMLTFWKI